MRVLLPLTLIATLLGGGAPAEAASPAQVIVLLRDPGSDPGVHARASGAELRHAYRHAVRGWAGAVPADALDRLRSDASVASVELDGRVRAATTQQSAPWGLDRIDQRARPLSGTYTYNHDGTGVTAYVIDSGVRLGHTELGGRARSGIDLVDGGEAEDCSGHGTAVAGVVAGRTVGVARGAQVVAVRVLDCAGAAPVSDVIAGIDWMTGVHVPGEPAVATLSMAGAASDALDAAVTAAMEDGITVAVAAGNADAFAPAGDACALSPARVAGALTAGATDAGDVRAPTSNHGPCVDMFAPGSEIPTAGALTDTSYTVASGTSLAAAHVAGVAALYLQGRPAATASFVANALAAHRTRSVVTDALGSPPDLLYTTSLPALTPDRAEISFGAHRPGAPTTPEAVVVTNTGDASLHLGVPSLAGEHASDFLVTTDTCAGAVLAPAESCVLAARFTAGALGARVAAWTVPSDADGSPYVLPVHGLGAMPDAHLDVSSLAFGAVRTGITSSARTVTLTNTGSAPLTVMSTTIGGSHPGDFSRTADGCGSKQVAPGASCSIGVAFTPASDGPREATLAISTDAPGSPHAVALTGSGFTPTPSLTLSPASLSFGLQSIGTTSLRRTVTVTSSGGEALVLGTVTLQGTDAASFTIVSDSCSGKTLAPSTTCGVGATFSPADARTHAAELVLPSNADGPARKVTLSGTGVVPTPVARFVPSSLSFPPRLVGTTSPASAVTITNVGGAPLELGTGTLGGTHASDYRIVSTTCNGASLDPALSCRVEIVFAPSATNTRSAHFTISSNASGSPHVVSLSGVGAVAIATVTPTQVAFPATLLGTKTQPAEVQLKNTGNGPLTVGLVSITGAHPGDFRITSDGCSGGELVQTMSCAVKVLFAPVGTGARSARLEFPSNGSATPRIVTLSGTGFADTAPPVSEWRTRDDTILIGGLHFASGVVTDDVTGVDRVLVTFVHTLTQETRVVEAGTHCALAGGRRGCTFHVGTPLVPGIYDATASGRDFAGNVEAGPTVRLRIL